MDSVTAFIAVVLNLLALAIFIRILLTWLPIAPWHPAVRMLDRITEPVLAPFRRLIPPMGGFDLSPAVAIVVLTILARIVGGRYGLQGALLDLVNAILVALILLVFIRVLFSLLRFDPWNPIVLAVNRITEPGLRPLRKWFPVRRPVDLAAVVVLAVLVLAWYLLPGLFRSSAGLRY
jgi:YggT family protein